MGRFFRTRLRVHYSWILAFIFITWTVTTQFSINYPFWIRIASGTIASVSFFLSFQSNIITELLFGGQTTNIHHVYPQTIKEGHVQLHIYKQTDYVPFEEVAYYYNFRQDGPG